MWKEGVIGFEGKIYRYQAKVYDEPSQFGICEGRISKCCISRDGEWVANYDRGWDMKPVDKAVEAVLEIIKASYPNTKEA